MRRMTLAMTVLMLIMLAGACQSVDRSETEEEIAGSVSLYLAAGYTGAGSIGVPSLDHAQGPVYDRIRAFRQRYPEIVLEFGEYHYLGGSTFPDEFPDVIEITPYQARWVAENELQELGSTVSAWSADQTGGYAEVIERMKIGGSVWLLPLKVEPMVAYYDETVFAHLGIQTPHDHWTWDDFLAASRQLAQYGYVTDMPDTFEAAEPIIKGLGGSYTSPDGAVFTGYLNGAATIAAFEQYLSILNETRTEGKGAGDTPALGIAWPSELYPILKDHADIRIARLPVFPDGNRYNSMFATGLAMHSGARDKTAALELMKAVLDVQDRRLLRFVNAHALTAREPRYKTDAPPQWDNLLDVMALESAVASPNIFQLNANVRAYYGALTRYPNKNIASLFTAMAEGGTAEQVLNDVADYVDSLNQTQRGNWDSY